MQTIDYMMTATSSILQVFIYLNRPLPAECNTRLILKRSNGGLKSEFSVSLTGCRKVSKLLVD